MEYLGHIIFGQGVQAVPNKLKAIKEWPEPKSLTALRAFLGLIGFYRHFVLHYATIAGPLTDLLKSKTFSWPPTTASAFQNLKEAMLNLPVLTLSDFSQAFEVTTNASIVAVGDVLPQNHHPIGFFSKKMSSWIAAS